MLNIVDQEMMGFVVFRDWKILAVVSVSASMRRIRRVPGWILSSKSSMTGGCARTCSFSKKGNVTLSVAVALPASKRASTVIWDACISSSAR